MNTAPTTVDAKRSPESEDLLGEPDIGSEGSLGVWVECIIGILETFQHGSRTRTGIGHGGRRQLPAEEWPPQAARRLALVLLRCQTAMS